MTTVGDISQYMNILAPASLAEEWDNVGLLVGDPDAMVKRAMTCLTITPESAAEAVNRNANVVVTHHPLPFRPMNRLTTCKTASRLLLQLIKSDIAVISSHTAFDSAAQGINAQLAEKFDLTHCKPLVPSVELGGDVGSARIGEANAGTSLQTLIDLAKSSFEIPSVRFVGNPDQPVSRVALCCGSGGAFLESAIGEGCDAMITGEATFHTCLEAKANGIALLLLGHHASERFAVEALASELGNAFDNLTVWASEDESDPVQTG